MSAGEACQGLKYPQDTSGSAQHCLSDMNLHSTVTDFICINIFIQFLYTYKTHIQNIFLFIISPSCLARKSCKLDDGFRFLKVAFVTGLQTAGPGLSGAPCVLCSELSNRIECRVLMGFGRA